MKSHRSLNMGFKILWISFVNFFNKSDRGEIFLFFLNYAFNKSSLLVWKQFTADFQQVITSFTQLTHDKKKPPRNFWFCRSATLLRKYSITISSTSANDCVKLLRTVLIDCMSTFATTKKWLHSFKNKGIPGKQMHELPMNY